MDKSISGLNRLYQDLERYSKLLEDCDDSEDLEFYETILCYLDGLIKKLESTVDCEVEDGK